MNIQIQKEEIEGAIVEARRVRRGLKAMAEVIRMEVRRRREVAGIVNGFGEALALVCERSASEPQRLADAARARKLAKLDRQRVLTLNDGQALASLNKEQAKTLRKADDIEAAARAVLAIVRVEVEPGVWRKVKSTATPAQRRTARGQIGEAFTLRAGVEAERQAALAKRQDDLRLGEAAALDALREDGEPDSQIERRRGQKDVRLRGRDGLRLMHERGAFTPRDAAGELRRDQHARMLADRLLAVGLRYRDKYEMAQSDLKSCLANAGGSREQPHFWAQGAMAHARANRARSLRQWEMVVVGAHGVEAMEVLRAVAGEARTVASLTSSGHRRVRLTTLLVAALTVIGDKVATTG